MRSGQLSCLFLVSIPLAWATGLAPAMAVLFAGLLSGRIGKTGLAEAALAVLALVLMLSLALATVDGAQGQRILAAGWNIIIVLCAGIALAAGRNLDPDFDHDPKAGAVIVGFFFVYAGFVCASFLLFSGKPVAFSSLVLGLAEGELPGLLGYYQQAKIIGIDWRWETPVPRPYAWGAYYNEGALLFLVSGLAGAMATHRKLLALLILILTGLGLGLIGSRMLLLAFVASIALGYVFSGSQFARKMKAGALLLLAASAPLTAIAAPDLMQAPLNELANVRQSSSETRFDSYRRGIEAALEKPVLGLGIKPREPLLDVPVGSHSSLVSTFTKSGFVGLIPLLMFMGVVLVGALRLLIVPEEARVRVPLATSMLCTLAWMITQDFDAPIYGTMLAFMLIGSGLSYGRRSGG